MPTPSIAPIKKVTQAFNSAPSYVLLARNSAQHEFQSSRQNCIPTTHRILHVILRPAFRLLGFSLGSLLLGLVGGLVDCGLGFRFELDALGSGVGFTSWPRRSWETTRKPESTSTRGGPTRLLKASTDRSESPTNITILLTVYVF